MDISKFASNLELLGGAATTNRFLVDIKTPKSLVATGASERLGLLCESTPLPGVAIGTDDRSQPYGYGPNYKMPWGVVFTDMNLVFIGDAKGFVHNFFFNWMNSIVNFNNESVTKITPTHVPYFVAYKDDYTTTVNIQALDVANQRIMSFKLFDCFPTLLDDIQGSWSNNNQIMRIGIRLNFTRWNVTYEKLNATELVNLQKVQVSTNSNLNQQQADNLYNLTGNPSPANSKPKYLEFVETYRNVIPLISTTDYNY